MLRHRFGRIGKTNGILRQHPEPSAALERIERRAKAALRSCRWGWTHAAGQSGEDR